MDTNVFHRWKCRRCESTHYEHERPKSAFARFVAKHASRCGRPQEPRHVLPDDVIHEIETREIGTLVVPDDWARRHLRETAPSIVSPAEILRTTGVTA
jgi:hypothetical protein